jgi:hypothetical protein
LNPRPDGYEPPELPNCSTPRRPGASPGAKRATYRNLCAMNSKAKGEISEGCVIAHVLKLGYSASIPFGNNQRYDLILDDGERLWRVQVKTAHYHRGCLVFSASSTNGFTGAKANYRGQADLFLVYSPDTDKVYRVPVEDVGRYEVWLRVDDPKGTAPKTTIRWARDYEM